MSRLLWTALLFGLLSLFASKAGPAEALVLPHGTDDADGGKTSAFAASAKGGTVGILALLEQNVEPKNENRSTYVLKESFYETRSCHFNLNLRISERELCLRDKGMLHDQLGCEVEEEVVFPTGRRLIDAGNGEPSPWEQVGEVRCVAPDEASEGDLLSAMESEFARLPITPAPLTIQPGAGWTFVNVPTIVHSTAEAQILTTELLGTRIEVEVIPSAFTWNFGDSTPPLTTTEPGAPYPDHTIDHTYTHTGNVDIALTTTWSGKFRPSGSGPWLSITGTATTTTTAPTLEVREARSRLVEDPLN